jgi:hypothetical protein
MNKLPVPRLKNSIAQVALPTDEASYLQIMMIGKETSERTLGGL